MGVSSRYKVRVIQRWYTIPRGATMVDLIGWYKWFIDDKAIAELEELNNRHNLAISCGDVENYIYINFQFHRKIYSYGQPQALMPLIESLWLQIAPFMQSIFAQIKEADALSQGNDQHRQALDAIKSKDAKLLEHVIRADILDGAIGLQQAKGWPLSGHTSLLNA